MRKPRAINPWSVFSGFFVSLHRTIALIDGFNLYHAIAGLRRPELKWVNLKTLATTFINTSIEQLDEIAKAFAESEFEKYRVVQDRLFESDFDKYVKQALENQKKLTAKEENPELAPTE